MQFSDLSVYLDRLVIPLGGTCVPFAHHQHGNLSAISSKAIMDVRRSGRMLLYRLGNETKPVTADDYRPDVNLSPAIRRVAGPASV